MVLLQTSNEANEVSGAINHGRMSITEEDEAGEDLSEEDRLRYSVTFYT